MVFKRFGIVAILLCLSGFAALMAVDPPAGILIVKSSPSDPDTQAGRIVEYQTITEHMVPVTDYVSVSKPDGDRDDIPKNLIIRRVDYPRIQARNIISAGGLNATVLAVQELQRVVSNYPQAHKYLDARISLLQKEIDLFNLGSRKINGIWISSEDFEAILAREHARRVAIIEAKKRAEAEAAEIKRKADEERAEKQRKAEEEAIAEAKRLAAEKAALEAKKQVEHRLKQKKAALAAAEKAPPPSAFSNIRWPLMLFVLFVGGGTFFIIRRMKGPGGPSSIGALDWPKFELLVAEIYRRRGYAVEISSGFGTEEGLDVKLTRGGEAILVQCKHWKVLKDYKVGAQEIEGLYMKVANEPGQQGIFVSTGEYTQEAREFVEGKPLQLLGVGDIEALMPQVAYPDENILNVRSWIREFIANAKIIDPVCPKCRKAMDLKTSRDGTATWRCPDFPNCEGKLEARADLVKGRRR